MNIQSVKDRLKDCTQLGIPLIPPHLLNTFFDLFHWALEGKPEEGRQVWFGFPDPKSIRDEFSPSVRPRILVLTPEQVQFSLSLTPSEALLLYKDFIPDPNEFLDEFWKERGCYSQTSNFGEFSLWIWKSKNPRVFVYGLDHHHAVLWDAKQTLRLLGITLDFFWLHDNRDPVNEAIPNKDPPFYSSLDLYKTPVDKRLDREFIYRIQTKYSAILTSHSLITAYRLKEVGLPHFHINSTRFGNEWVTNPQKHAVLLDFIQEMLQKNKLHVLHNNLGDSLYFHQFFSPKPSQECIIPSICESFARKRLKTVNPMKFLIWDTRQVLIRPDASPFMKELFSHMVNRLPDMCDSQAILLAEKRKYLPEGFLDKYTAVIHIPYNVSTMSIYEQTTANIPLWVPSKALLKKLWTDPKEPNELSWTVFAEGSGATASFLDQARTPEAVNCWVESADFYDNRIADCIFTFDSIEDLLNRITTVDYQEAIEKNIQNQKHRQQNIIATWESLFRPLLTSQKN